MQKALRTLLVRLLLVVGTGEISNFDLVRDLREVFGFIEYNEYQELFFCLPVYKLHPTLGNRDIFFAFLGKKML